MKQMNKRGNMMCLVYEGRHTYSCDGICMLNTNTRMVVGVENDPNEEITHDQKQTQPQTELWST